jgi:poly(3-hydroxybutyrate) depolymerase
MRTLLLLLLVASAALAQTRIVIIRPGHRPVVINRRPGGLADTRGSYQGRVTVATNNRFDWEFAAPPGVVAAMPKDAPKGGFAESYQLLQPPGMAAGKEVGLLLHLSASSTSDEYNLWAPVCAKYGLAYVCPYGVGDEADPGLRLRTALTVLDDLRQRTPIDPDRIYVTGTGNGALTACQIAYCFPEFVGGLIAVGSATSLRAEPYLRDRVRERLSVVLMAGTLDPGRHELERVRANVLKENEISHRMITVPDHGKGLPSPAVLEQAVGWLESGRLGRVQLTRTYPATRGAGGAMTRGDDFATALVAEARERLRRGRTDEGLMLLQGVLHRWPAAAAAKDAKTALDEHDAKGKRTWREWYDKRQVEHFNREAQALDEFVKLLGGVRGVAVNPGLIPAAIAMYEQVEQFGPETREGQRATRRLEELRKINAKR